MKIVAKPVAIRALRNSVRSEAPRTISGVDIGRKIEHVRRATTTEAVPHDREREERAEDRRDDGRDETDLERRDDSVPDAGDANPSYASCRA